MGFVNAPVLETQRLILRPWREEDAETLYHWASDPQIGPAAGWLPHRDVADSLTVLRTVLMKPDTWAVTLKGSDAPVGSIGVFPCALAAAREQPEIGYWIARPFWGQGYIPEAVLALIGRCFSQGAAAVWCDHAVQNYKSRRVIEKCGFVFYSEEDWTGSDGLCRRTRYYSIPREAWTE